MRWLMASVRLFHCRGRVGKAAHLHGRGGGGQERCPAVSQSAACSMHVSRWRKPLQAISQLLASGHTCNGVRTKQRAAVH